LYETLAEKLIAYGGVDLTNINYASMQWASANLLNNPDLGFDEGNYFASESLSDIGMTF